MDRRFQSKRHRDALVGRRYQQNWAGPDWWLRGGGLGDTNQTTSGAAALVGTADDAHALFLQNNSTTNLTANIVSPIATGGVEILNVTGRFGSCNIDGGGNLACSAGLFGHTIGTTGGDAVGDAVIKGNLFVTGTKSSVASLDDGRRVALYAIEAPENWFEDYGGGELENGMATIDIEPTFLQAVNTNVEYRVFLTPKGDCEGLYVTNEGPQGFEVRELKGGRSSVAFDYRIIAHREGYETVRLADASNEIGAADDKGSLGSTARAPH